MSGPLQYAIDFTQKRPPAVQQRIAEGMAAADAGANHYWKRLVDDPGVAVWFTIFTLLAGGIRLCVKCKGKWDPPTKDGGKLWG